MTARAGTTRAEITGRGGSRRPGPSEPAASSDGALTAGVHWLRLTGRGVAPETVAQRIAVQLGETPQAPKLSARYTYSAAIWVGPVVVYYSEGREDVCVDITGSACEALGTEGVAWFMGWQNGDAEAWRATRVDVALDGVPFTPAQLRAAWIAGDVRTLVKVPKDARVDRQWRTCDWSVRSQGDLFGMGSRESRQYARCYDRRGPTRFELELKAEAAVAALPELRVLLGDARAFGLYAVSLVRRFVDFVERVGTNASRMELLPWWSEFVNGASKAWGFMTAKPARSASEVMEYALAQWAPMLAVVESVFGPGILTSMARDGRRRWGKRHRVIVGVT